MISHVFTSRRRRLLVIALAFMGTGALFSQTQTARPAGNAGRGGYSGGIGLPGGGGGIGGASGNSNGTRQYPNSTMVGDAMISSDLDTRRLIVITDDQTNENIKQVIADLDRPKPQVLINVVFLQVTHNNDLDLGTTATYHDNNIGHSTTQTAQTILGAVATSGGFYSLHNTNLDATIHALSTVGKTEILSRPSILTRSSQQATILVGQQVPFITDSRITDAGQTINTVQYQDIGIILRVTPFITAQGMVEMIVSPEISSLSDRTVPISNTVNTPVIDKRSADTVVVTPSDNTVVIGGLISNQTTNTDNKVPILGDIPIIGYAFKHKVKSTQRTELLIFLTPHVVQKPEDLVQLAKAERENMELSSKAFDKKDLQKYTGDH